VEQVTKALRGRAQSFGREKSGRVAPICTLKSDHQEEHEPTRAFLMGDFVRRQLLYFGHSLVTNREIESGFQNRLEKVFKHNLSSSVNQKLIRHVDTDGAIEVEWTFKN
jgi:hypothetical protein